MNIVFLIGNGFDLNLGMKTRYSDFFDYYINKHADDSRGYISDFVQEIKDNGKITGNDWSDFELSFGRYSGHFGENNYEDYIGLWEDVHGELARYIRLQENFPISTRLLGNPDAAEFLAKPDNFLERETRQHFKKLRNEVGFSPNSRIDIINFNYTKTFEALYGWNNSAKNYLLNDGKCVTVNSVTHIHGTTNKHMILGVDNLSQLGCVEAIRNQDRIKHRLVKPIANKNTRTMRDQDCARRIAEANIICIFGMSLGETDETWWKLVAKRLKAPDAMLIIFTKNNKISEGKEYLSVELEDEMIKKFLNVSGIVDSNLAEKIKIGFNSDIFGIFSGIANRH